MAWPGLECFYGGAAGGGKSVGLLMCALQYADCAGYASLLLRRTYTDLSLPGALMDIANQWLRETDAVYSALTHTWTFPSGATLTFGFLENENDKYRYQSSEFQFIGFDELTQFTESQYLYLFSRLRKLHDSHLPLRVRAASNPGGIGHEWVKERFIEQMTPGRLFIPATLQDNPFLDKVAYEDSLHKLDPITQAQLLHGDWRVRAEGNMFKRQWMQLSDEPHSIERCVRFWDRAATEAKPGHDPDYTVGLKLGIRQGIFYVLDIVRARLNPGETDRLIRQTAELDGVACAVFQEEESGASGKTLTEHTSNLLQGFSFRGVRPTGDKVVRAQPASACAYNQHLRIVRAPWNAAFLNELELFPSGAHDDQVDALSGAYTALTQNDVSRFAVVGTGKVRG